MSELLLAGMAHEIGTAVIATNSDFSRSHFREVTIMTRFYFHIREDGELLKDNIGVELPSVEEARDEAVASARDLLADRIKHGDALDDRRFEVWDEAGVPHFVLPFKDAIGIG